MSTKNRTATAALAASLAVIFGTAGCSGSSPSSASGNPAVNLNNGKPAGNAGTATHAPIKVCDVLPAASVAQITGAGFSKGEEDDTPSYGIYSCNYTGDTVQMDISVLTLDAKPGFDADKDALTQAGQTPTSIPNLGDDAFTNGVEGGAEALFGDVSIKVTGFTSMTAAMATQLINAVHSKM